MPTILESCFRGEAMALMNQAKEGTAKICRYAGKEQYASTKKRGALAPLFFVPISADQAFGSVETQDGRAAPDSVRALSW